MLQTLDRVCERATGLSNHIRRHIRAVERHREAVAARLEETGKLGHVSLGEPAPDLGREMRVIAGIASDDDERRRFLAFYYALQYIVMEIHALDTLRYHLVLAKVPPEEAYHRCAEYAQRRFEDLVMCYLERVGEILLPPEHLHHLALFGVGTMGDRDDVDVAAVDDLDDAARPELSAGLSRLAQVMLKTSCSLHFHMAEALGAEHLTETVGFYEKTLRARPYSPVVISQLLNATPLLGSRELADRFVGRVPSRYFFHSGHDNIDHEGFLRAMLGELQELLQRQVPAEFVNPKDDGLRLIKGYLSLAKSVHHIPARNWVGILEFLQIRHVRFRKELSQVERTLTFLETARYLYQLLVVEEEEIDTREGVASDGLRVVAERMGFSRRGALSCTAPFLMSYYKHVDETKAAIRNLIEELVDHLRLITTVSFKELAASSPGPGAQQNLAVAHAVAARRFFTTRFWDDLLGELARPSSEVASRYVRDLASLSPARRAVIIRALVEWGVQDLASWGGFLIVVRQQTEAQENTWLFDELVDLFLGRCSEEPGIADRFAKLYSLWPSQVERFTAVLDPPRLGKLSELASLPLRRTDLQGAAANLQRLIEVHQATTREFRGPFRDAVKRHPQALALLDNPGELRVLAETLYGQAERFSDLLGRREWLEAYHQLETTRLGLEFLAGTTYHRLLLQYRQGMHILLRSIYFLCRSELYALYRTQWSARHSLGIYVDAGCLGFHPFDPDINVLVLAFHEDTAMERFFAEVVSSFAEELGRLGFRLRQFPGDGDAPLAPRRLEQQLDLLERSQAAHGDPLERLALLRFSRVVGTRGQLQRYAEGLVRPFLAPLDGQLRELMRTRLEAQTRQARGDGFASPIDPRHMPGGVNDVERLFLMLCAENGHHTMCSRIPSCGLGDPEQSAELAGLTYSMALLQVLATARRVLAADLPPGLVDPSSVSRHAGLLARHRELGDDLIRDPIGHLAEVGTRNLELIGRILSSLG